jgi:hypothetical protein
VITKTKFWQLIRENLKEAEKSREFTSQIMERIKELGTNEVDNEATETVRS